MPRIVPSSSSSQNAALWLAAGAVAGVVLGVILADCAGGGRKVMRRLRRVASSAADWMRSVDISAFDDMLDDAPSDATAEPDLDEGDEDARIDERVLEAFQNDPILAERAIEIDEPEPGTIQLTGPVPSAKDAAHAVTIARGTPGVTTVRNHLRVRGRTRR